MRRGGVLAELRVGLLELTDFAVGAPQRITGACVAEVRIAVLLKTEVEIEAARQLVGERLVVDKAVCVCRADGPFVEAHRVEVAALDACDLGSDQGVLVGECRWTTFGPTPNLIAVRLKLFTMRRRVCFTPIGIS